MMTIVQRSVEVNASPQVIMDKLIDAIDWPNWYPGIAALSVAGPFPERDGTVSFTMKSAGMSIPITETVIDYEPGRLHLFRMDGMLSGQARWEVSPHGDGTRLTTTFDYGLRGGVFGKVADTLVVKRLNTKGLQQGLNNLKALVERQ